MLTWLGNNAGTIVVCAALAAVIALIVVSRIKAPAAADVRLAP